MTFLFTTIIIAISLLIIKIDLSLQQSNVTWYQAQQVSPQIVASINYENFKISIYQNALNDADPNSHNKKQFYYSPLLILNPTSSYYSYNEFEQLHQMIFEIQMWNDELEKLVYNYVKERDTKIEPSQISVLPIEQVKVEFPIKSNQFKIDNTWISYSNQPKFLHFRVLCSDELECGKLIEKLKQQPEIFYGMEIYYSLDAQKSTRKLISIKREHFVETQLFVKLSQNDYFKQYIREQDLNTLISDITSNIVSEFIEDNEFLDTKEDISVTSLIRQQLEVQTVFTSTFNDQLWQNVYWYDDNTRPDKLINDLNYIFDKSDNFTRIYIIRELEVFKKISTLGNTKYLPYSNLTESTIKRKDVDEILAKINNERDTFVEVKNERFIPRPIKLYKVNTNILQDRQVISTRRLKVGYFASILRNKVVISFNRTDKPVDRIGLLEIEFKAQYEFLRQTVNELAALKLEVVPSTMLGEIRYSLLTPEQFQEYYGPEWILLNGSSILNSDLHRIFGWAKLPDARGLFLRGKQNGRSDNNGNPDGDLALGEYQRDMFESHTHSYTAYQFPNMGSSGKVVGVWGSSTDKSTGFAGGIETRPRSITVNIYIKINNKTK